MESIFEALLSSAIYWLPVLGVISVCITRMSDLGWRQNLCQALCLPSWSFWESPRSPQSVYRVTTG